MDCVFKCGEARKNERGFYYNQIHKDESSCFDKIVYLIHLELIDGSYNQVPTNVTSEEERKQDRTGEKRKRQ